MEVFQSRAFSILVAKHPENQRVDRTMNMGVVLFTLCRRPVSESSNSGLKNWTGCCSGVPAVNNDAKASTFPVRRLLVQFLLEAIVSRGAFCGC
mmetsp:Transcript_31248/g.83156  ORF Transcript_31248/g.83156 Transcript_31248/m.83156 type:complete len:94 (-) Transcript_31248:65-346(-)